MQRGKRGKRDKKIKVREVRKLLMMESTFFAALLKI